METIGERLAGNTYPGRGIILGRTADGKNAAIAYFIMGRSTNSRNRIFVEDGDGIRTEAFDPSLLTDPSLIIYAPVRTLGKKTIVTNGDQTDTVRDLMEKGSTFEDALATRCFEPDAPNYTPRISGLVDIEGGKLSLKLSILKSDDGNPEACNRFTYAYENPAPGAGRFIHTYVTDGNPLPSFTGEPEVVKVADSAGEFASEVWDALDPDNRVSLFVRYIDIESGATESVIINRHVNQD